MRFDRQKRKLLFKGMKSGVKVQAYLTMLALLSKFFQGRKTAPIRQTAREAVSACRLEDPPPVAGLKQGAHSVKPT
jgi:hypothetical protein